MNHLFEKIQRIWEEKVKPVFHEGRIASERHLQAIIYKAFEDEAVYAWVEPKLSGKKIERLEGYTPDILFTNANKIIAVMELKYSPYYKAEPQGDLYRFNNFLKEKHDEAYEIYLRINPENGDLNTREFFKLDDDLRFIYGVIAKKGSSALNAELKEQFTEGSFFHLTLGI